MSESRAAGRGYVEELLLRKRPTRGGGGKLTMKMFIKVGGWELEDVLVLMLMGFLHIREPRS